LISIVMFVASSATADPWKTTIDTVLRKKPGERQAVVAKLPSGTIVVIEKEEGRWLRVRVGNRVGYVTRTTVADMKPAVATGPAPDTLPISSLPSPTPEPAVRANGPSNTWSADRIKATKSGTSGLFVGTSAKTSTLYAEPKLGAAKVAEVERGKQLAVIDGSNPTWIKVRDDEGREAWIARADVDSGTAGVAITGSLERTGTSARPDTFVRAVAGRFVMRADAAIGYRSLGMDFTSNGSAGLANYLVSADAMAAKLDVDVLTRLSAATRIGFDGRVELSTSSPGPGIDYIGPSRTAGKIPFSTFGADAGLRVGMRAKRVFDLFVRGGFHYDAFISKDVENAGRLPREQLVGGTLGARAEIVPPSSRVSVSVRFDTLVLGSRSQTPGLEDGASNTAGAVWAGATIRVLVRRHLSLLSAYDFGRASTHWTGMSVREPGTTDARRVDSSQIVQVGLSAEL
jgi:SH3-like domain-containing protein